MSYYITLLAGVMLGLILAMIIELYAGRADDDCSAKTDEDDFCSTFEVMKCEDTKAQKKI